MQINSSHLVDNIEQLGQYLSTFSWVDWSIIESSSLQRTERWWSISTHRTIKVHFYNLNKSAQSLQNTLFQRKLCKKFNVSIFKNWYRIFVLMDNSPLARQYFSQDYWMGFLLLKKDIVIVFDVKGPTVNVYAKISWHMILVFSCRSIVIFAYIFRAHITARERWTGAYYETENGQL